MDGLSHLEEKTMKAELLDELVSLKQAKALNDALTRLQLHPDFNAIFTKHFFDQLPLELVENLGDVDAERRKVIEESLLCISYVKKHLRDIKDAGDKAVIEISNIESINQ